MPNPLHLKYLPLNWLTRYGRQPKRCWDIKVTLNFLLFGIINTYRKWKTERNREWERCGLVAAGSAIQRDNLLSISRAQRGI